MDKRTQIFIAVAFMVGIGVGYVGTIEYAKHEYAEMMLVYNSSEASSRITVLSQIRSNKVTPAIKRLESSLDMDLLGLYALGESSDSGIQTQVERVWKEASTYRCKHPRNASNSTMPKEVEMALAEKLDSKCEE